jgi:ABC-type Fe3+-citrate transport system substrate-binding protein
MNENEMQKRIGELEEELDQWKDRFKKYLSTLLFVRAEQLYA